MLSTLLLIIVALVAAGLLLQTPLWLLGVAALGGYIWLDSGTDAVLLYALAVACCWVFGAFMGWLSRRELQRQGTKQ